MLHIGIGVTVEIRAKVPGDHGRVASIFRYMIEPFVVLKTGEEGTSVRRSRHEGKHVDPGV